MADIGPLFLKGIKDSISIKQGLLDVLSSPELVRRTLQITAINGFVYLGSVYLYNFFISSFFDGQQSSTEAV